MVDHCKDYAEKVLKKKEEGKEDELYSQFSAYICPNPGSSTNMGSKKQRLMFLEIERDNHQKVLEQCKIVDVVLMVMSCKETKTEGLKVDPDNNSNAIDDVGY